MPARRSSDDRLLQTVMAPLAAATPSRVLIGYSGGLDSTVLLHLLARHAPVPVTAIHVHHGLQAAADGWAEHCARVCAGLGVPLQTVRVRVAVDDPAGPEAAARAARQAAFAEALARGDWLALAHHREDQAETVLLRLLRGSGVDGLAGMAALAPFAAGWCWRPLLGQPRALLRAYAVEHGLRWIEDPHNVDPRYTRSWLRGEILPRLRERHPAVDEALARTAAQAAEARTLLEELATADLAAAGADAQRLPLAPLRALSAPRRRNALRRWLARPLPPEAALLARVEQALIEARADAQPQLAFDGDTLRRYRETLYRLPALPSPPEAGLSLDWNASLPPGCGTVDASGPPPWPLQWRFARGGEALRVAEGGRTRSLRNLWQEAGVPPWERLRTPLLYRGEVLVAVGDRWCCPAFARDCAQAGWQWRWSAAPELRV